ncbi:HlyD family secretion protein [Scytonema sp. PRP1]|uniref:HlyD family secretion protein n=1 Tax=Scytonema sp. PRP1 TaxID=3120513 RepID=UPI002FD71E7C
MLYTHHQKLLPSVGTEDFLPPVSRWTSLAGIFLVANVGAAIALSSYIKYNVTVKAPATVRPTGEIRLVQPSMEGTIKSIFVKTNQIVKKGDIIAQLDDTELHIKNSQLQGNIQEGNLQLAQIDAQIKALDTQIEAEKRVIERTVASAKADLARNQREYQEQEIKAQSEVLAAQANLEKSEVGRQKAKTDLVFAIKEQDRFEQLVKEGVIAQRQFDEKQLIVLQTKAGVQAEQKAVDIAKANLQTAKAALKPSGGMVAIAQERIAQETAKGDAGVAAFIREKKALIQRQIEMRNQIRQSQKEVEKNNLQRKNSVIRATSNGVVLKLNLRNPGQVVNPSEAIAEIVPQNAPLVIKAMVPATEIKKVAVGQTVQLRVDACPYPDYGTLKGVVSALSPDAITSQSNNTGTIPSVSYFEATIKPERLSFGNQNRKCLIQPGMDAKADIISKEETALQFMLRRARLISDL